MPLPQTSPAHRTLRRLVLVTLSVCLLAARVPPAFGQTPKWVQVPPPQLANFASAFDSNRDRMLFVSSTTVWALDLSANDPHWTDLEVRPNPTAEQGSVVYDSRRDRLIAFQYRVSGLSYSVPAQVWALNLASPPFQWVRLPDDGNLGFDNCCMGMVYDPVRDQILAVGGGDRFGSNGGGLRAMSLSGTVGWSLAPTTGAGPTDRRSPSVVYDPKHDRILVYGGFLYGFTTFFDETWSLPLSGPGALTWSFLAPTQYVALARTYHVAVVDTIGERMIVSGGTSHDDTWALDLAAPPGTAVWTPIAPPPANQPWRTNAGASMDPVHNRMVLYGGYSGDHWLADTWSLDLSGTPHWIGVDPGADPPRIGEGRPMGVIDPMLQQMLIAFPESRTWTRRLDRDENWHQVITPTPDARSGTTAVSDPSAGRALAFGGESTIPTSLDETWAYRFAPPGWSQLSPGARPGPRADALGLFDPVRRKFILFGGQARSPIGHPRSLSDTWSFDAATNQWAPLAAGPVTGRWGAVGAYDPVRDRMMMFGGQDSIWVPPDTYVLPLSPGGTWTLLPTTGTPPASFDVRGAVYDPAADRLLVVARPDTLRVWQLSLAGSPNWSEVPASGRHPRFLDDIAMDLDAARGRAVLFGHDLNARQNSETWALYFDEAVTGVSVALVRSDLSADRVELEWAVETGSEDAVTAYRRGEGKDWGAIASLVPDWNGRAILVDRDVERGARYDYRLGVPVNGGERFFGLVSILVPSDYPLRLDGVRPNPAVGSFDLSFTLADASPATLEVVDVGGRLVMEKDVGSLGPGEHTMRIADPGTLPAGLYFVRLVQGGSRLVTRVAILH